MIATYFDTADYNKNVKNKDNITEYLDFMKQDVEDSAQSVFKAAEKALVDNPSIRKVVLMNHLPRFDTTASDPLQLKPSFSVLFNNILKNSQWIESPLKDRIFVGTHVLDTSGREFDAIFRDSSSGNRDGVQLRGKCGRKVYTDSVLGILKSSKLISHQFNISQFRSAAQPQNKPRTFLLPKLNRMTTRIWGN